MKNKIVFLFGAGISVEAGLPTGKDLTDKLLERSNFLKHPLGMYDWNEVMDFQNEMKMSEQMYDGMKLINTFISQNIKKKLNYEDIFYFSLILSSFKTNIKYQQLFNFIDEKMKTVLVSYTDSIGFDKRIYLYMNLCDYIQQFVWRKLCKLRSISYLNLVVDACLNTKVEEVSIFTLNHDLVLEKLFKKNKIKYIDGFGNVNNEVRYWNPELFETDSRVKLYKLHGSINWLLFQNESNLSKLGIPETNDIFHTIAENGKPQYPKDGLPFFLTGTKNKILDYENNEYIKIIIDKFKDKISTVNTIITSGYGFGDDGINRILENWINFDKKRKIININKSHPDVSFKDKIITNVKYIQDTAYDEIIYLLEENK